MEAAEREAHRKARDSLSKIQKREKITMFALADAALSEHCSKRRFIILSSKRLEYRFVRREMICLMNSVMVLVLPLFRTNQRPTCQI